MIIDLAILFTTLLQINLLLFGCIVLRLDDVTIVIIYDISIQIVALNLYSTDKPVIVLTKLECYLF